MPWEPRAYIYTVLVGSVSLCCMECLDRKVTRTTRERGRGGPRLRAEDEGEERGGV